MVLSHPFPPFLSPSPFLYRSTVHLMIRKLQYAPENSGTAPSVKTTREFVMSDKPLHLEASLDKEVGRIPLELTTHHWP